MDHLSVLVHLCHLYVMHVSNVPVVRNPARPARLHNAIPLEDVQWLSDFMNENHTPFERAIHILRRTHYPFHYDPHPWVNGMSCFLLV